MSDPEEQDQVPAEGDGSKPEEQDAAETEAETEAAEAEAAESEAAESEAAESEAAESLTSESKSKESGPEESESEEPPTSEVSKPKQKGPKTPAMLALEGLASLRLTVVLLAFSMLLVFSSTWAQIDDGIWTVQHDYFRTWIVLGALPYFKLYMPGGYTIGGLLLANLLAAHSVRFRLEWKRSGIILIHLGMILLLLGELLTGTLAVESNMDIDEGQWSNFSHDVREAELAIIDPTGAESESVVVISEAMLLGAEGEGAIHDPRLPFDVQVVKFQPNSDFETPDRTNRVAKDKLIAATHGIGPQLHMVEKDPWPGTDGKTDVPSAEVRLTRDGQELGTYLVSCWFDVPFVHLVNWNNDQPPVQHVMVDGKPYRIELRYRRHYKPYRIGLLDFSHDVYTGTNTPRNYSSKVRLVNPTTQEDREVLIYMNNPLRYEGETFFQSSFKNNDSTTVLQVVRNPAWTMPYLAVAIGSLGMFIHFGQNLLTFLRRRKKKLALTPAGKQRTA